VLLWCCYGVDKVLLTYLNVFPVSLALPVAPPGVTYCNVF